MSGKAKTMAAGSRVGQAINNYGDKKNGGASTVGNIIFTNNALSARRHPWLFDSRGGTIVGGVGMLNVDAAMHSDGVKKL